MDIKKLICATIMLCGVIACQQSAPDVETIKMSTPRYLVYYNSNASPLSAVSETDFTHVIVSFLRVTVDQTGTLQLQLPKKMEGQWSSVEQVRSLGKKVMVSYGGGDASSAEYSALVGREAELAKLLAGFVKQHQLDGVDIDFEASDMLHRQRAAGVGDGRAFLITLTQSLRDELPSPKYLLSHAPQPPYLDLDWHDGPYLDILKQVSGVVDWVTVQYYNNPGFNDPLPTGVESAGVLATSYTHLVGADGTLQWPSSKVLIGKPIYRADAVSGHIPPEKVISEVIQPMLKQYGQSFGGITGWQFSTLTADHVAWNKKVGEALIASDSSQQ